MVDSAGPIKLKITDLDNIATITQTKANELRLLNMELKGEDEEHEAILGEVRDLAQILIGYLDKVPERELCIS